MSETKFQVGDKVEAFGVEGVVICTTGEDPYPVEVEFIEKDDLEEFTPDGRWFAWHKEPSLKLIERPKKKVIKTMYQAIIRRGEGIFLRDILFSNETECKGFYGKEFIALGPAIIFEAEE